MLRVKIRDEGEKEDERVLLLLLLRNGLRDYH